jgi:hypothetical protein
VDPFAFILNFLNQFWIASRFVCSFCETMAGSFSMATTEEIKVTNNLINSGQNIKIRHWAEQKSSKNHPVLCDHIIFPFPFGNTGIPTTDHVAIVLGSPPPKPQAGKSLTGSPSSLFLLFYTWRPCPLFAQH